MLDSSLTTKLIADGLRSRLMAGIYPPGRALPSLSVLQTEFGAGRETVRAAIGLLAAEGLVDCAPRKCPRVASMAVACQQKLERVLADRRNILAYSYATAYLLPPLLSALADHNGTQRTSCKGPTVTERVCLGVMLSGGPLFRSLFELLLRHSYLPFFYRTCPQLEDSSKALVHCLTTGRATSGTVRKILVQAAHTVRDAVRAFLACHGPAPEPLPLDLEWCPAPSLTRKYLSILGETAVRIGTEAYPPGCYLPSEARLAAHYSVSVGTIRQAMQGLERLGLTQTINGRGTRILEKTDVRSLRGAGSPRNGSGYVAQAAHFLALVLPVCAKDAAGRRDAVAIKSVRDAARNERGIPMRVLFRFVVTMQRTPLLRLILGRIGNMCDWGLIVALSSDRAGTRVALRERSVALVERLLAGESEEFAAGLAHAYQEVSEKLSQGAPVVRSQATQKTPNRDAAF